MRGFVGEVASTSTVGVIAKWLLIVFATAILAFLAVPVVGAWDAGARDEIFSSLAFLPWFVGPAALAALLVARARSRVEAWLFVGAEAAAVASTVGVWTLFTFVDADHRNAQSGIALMVLPLAQFAAVLAYALGVLVIALFLRRTAPMTSPDTGTLADGGRDGRIFSILIIALFLSITLLAIYLLFI